MPRCRASLAPILAGWIAVFPAVAWGKKLQEPASIELEDPKAQTEKKFLDGLRDLGYFDLALDYLDQLRNDDETPNELKAILDFEEAQGLLEEAKFVGDLDRRDQFFEQARALLDKFLKENPSHPLVPEAKVLVAQLHFQRGQTENLRANEAVIDNEKQGKLSNARAAFARARTAFDNAIEDLQNTYDGFDTGPIPQDDPKFQAREDAQSRLLDARLKRALVDYEEAQTHEREDPHREKLLGTAQEQFRALYRSYRTWVAGIAARMWEAKCFEERGQIGEAIGIYNDLMRHEDERLFGLQRQVGYFKIIAEGKRGQHAVAADLADTWLRVSRGDTGSFERLGVQFELAKNLHKQLEAGMAGDDRTKKAASDRIVTLLSEVVRYASPFKLEAIALLKQYRPSTGLDPRQIANLTFDQALDRAQEAIASQEWDSAVTLLKAAQTKINAQREPEKANRARLLLAFASFNDQNYLEAAVLSDFLARRYPDWESAAQASELGLAANALSYESTSGPGKADDLARLQNLADYVINTWPNEEQADVARLMLGDVAMGQGRYNDAAEVFKTVRTPRHKLDAQAKAAAAHWRRSLVLRKEAGAGTAPPEAQAEADKARELLEATLEERRSAQALPTDPGLLETVADLAEIHVAEGRFSNAVELLRPSVQALADAQRNSALDTHYARILRLQLQAHIADGQTDEAIQAMKALETSESGEALTRLYFGLGRLLEQEMQALRDRGDRNALEQLRKTYQQFLEALVASEAGQTYESLQWAGEAMLSIDRPTQAEEIFERVLNEYPDHERLDRTKLKRVTALRQAGKFNDAWNQIYYLVEANPRSLDFLLERCRLLEDWAKAESGRWKTAISYWKQLGTMLGNIKPRPNEYYECWYHVAYGQHRDGQTAEARRTLKSIMALSNTLGSDEIKIKYERLLKQVGG